jgi:hypothetical protein
MASSHLLSAGGSVVGGTGQSMQLHRPSARSRVNRRAALAVRAAKTADGPCVAIVGVTGAVGQEFLKVRTVLAP